MIYLRKWKGLIRLTRPLNGAMAGVATIISALIAQGGFTSTFSITLGFVTVFTLSSASMVVNDYYDREVDVINAPKRPLPSGLISPDEALIFAVFLATIGLISAALTNLQCLMIAILALVVSVSYNTKGKKMGFVGNLMVSVCVGLTFLYGGFVAMASYATRILTLIFATIALLSNTGREITKGIPDVQGDKEKEINTIAAVFGPKLAAITSVCFYLSAVALTVIPWLLSYVSWEYIPVVAISDLGFITSSVSLLRDNSPENAKRVKNWIRAWMIIGLVAFAIGAC